MGDWPEWESHVPHGPTQGEVGGAVQTLPSCDQQFSYLQTVISDLMNSCFSTQEVARHTQEKPLATDRFKLLVHEHQQAWVASDLPRLRSLWNQVNRLGSSLRKNFYKWNMAATSHPPLGTGGTLSNHWQIHPRAPLPSYRWPIPYTAVSRRT